MGFISRLDMAEETSLSLRMLLLLLSRFSRVQLCATPQTAAHQAPPSLGFSRQGHWSGLPFPSPMHEREKGKRSRSVVSNSQRPHGLQPTRLLHPWDFPGKSTGVGCQCLLRSLRICQQKLPKQRSKEKKKSRTEYPITVKQPRKHNIYILEREKRKKQKKHLKKQQQRISPK